MGQAHPRDGHTAGVAVAASNGDRGVLVGRGLYSEELPAGFRFRTMGRTIAESDLLSFVNLLWYREEGFVNSQLVGTSAIAGRFVPGALVYCIAEGLVMPSVQFTARGLLQDQLDHKAPTLVGDTVRVEAEVIECRPAGQEALVRTRNEVRNQRDELVLVYTPLRRVASGREG